MPRAFEELASAQLDALYQGALFLCAADERAAETLLVDAVRHAFREHADRTGEERPHRWLERRLVRAFLESKPREPTTTIEVPALLPTTLDLSAVEPDRLLSAAATVPAAARAAIWLVVLQRWSYADAAEALDVHREQIPELIAQRDMLLGVLLGDSAGRPDLEAKS